MNPRCGPARGFPTGEGGFSLPEVIVTLVVLGVLVSISVPNYTAYKSKAQLAIIEEQVRFIEQGEEPYLGTVGRRF